MILNFLYTIQNICILVLFWYTKTKTKTYFSKGVHHFSILTKTKPKYNTPPLLKLKPNYNYFFLHELTKNIFRDVILIILV